MSLRIANALTNALSEAASSAPHQRSTTPPQNLLPQPANTNTEAALGEYRLAGAMLKQRLLALDAERTRGVTSANPPQMPTKDYWQRRVLENTGINPANWRPEKGFAANRENVQKVYALYERLFTDHPEMLWAGMAKMAGGVVYGGFQTIESTPSKIGIASGVLSGINPTLGAATLGYGISEKAYVERKLLTMQKDIFNDLAWQHMAFAEGGIKALEVAHQRGEIDKDNLKAWQLIASGDENRIWQGNEMLLRREQFDILQPHYDEMMKRGLSSSIQTRVMSWLTDSPMPDGRPMRGARGTVTFGNVMNFNDRWQWIQTETVTRFRNYTPEYRRTLVSQSLQELADRSFARNPRTPQPQPHPTPRRD